MLTLTLIDDNDADGDNTTVVINTIHSLRGLPFNLVLLCATGPLTLVIDPHEGAITWEGRTYTEWHIAHSDPTCALQLVCGPDETAAHWGPIASITMQADRLDTCFTEDDPIDGPWLTWWITETGHLRVEGNPLVEWRILEWSNDLSWERWKYRYSPIELPEPAQYGKVIDAYCSVGATSSALFESLPRARCWKLIHQDDRFYIVPRVCQVVCVSGTFTMEIVPQSEWPADCKWLPNSAW